MEERDRECVYVCVDQRLSAQASHANGLRYQLILDIDGKDTKDTNGLANRSVLYVVITGLQSKREDYIISSLVLHFVSSDVRYPCLCMSSLSLILIWQSLNTG